jgi:hypothetical protein
MISITQIYYSEKYKDFEYHRYIKNLDTVWFNVNSSPNFNYRKELRKMLHDLIIWNKTN